MPKPIRPYWNGMPLPGRRLVISTDQGFGHSFQFARYIPTPIPYLSADPMRRAHWRAELARRVGSDGVRVGLVWAGNIDNTSDWRRSLPLAALRELAEIPGIRLVSLQMPVPDADRDVFTAMGLPDLSVELIDFGETAAVFGNLDLVVSVDSAVAHLAGAMGVPVWTLIYEPADWRWMTRREDSPWYPTMRLFRQPRAGHWGEPVGRLIGALREFVVR